MTPLATSKFKCVQPVRVATLSFAIPTFLVAGVLLTAPVNAQEFPEVIALGSLDGTEGFYIDGEKTDNFLGASVSAAGDVNDDGIDDLIIGAPRVNTQGSTDAGRTYVLFGKLDGFTNLNASDLDASAGFTLDGESTADESGAAVAGVGDINGDAIDDIIIGAWSAPNGDRYGRVYVAFGTADGFSSTIQLAELHDGGAGFGLEGEEAGDQLGVSVAGGGDINGDGIDDFVIGANGSGEALWAGRSYVVFGNKEGGLSSVDLSGLDGMTGFQIEGEAFGNRSGWSVNSAGDLNDDGLDDIIIGAPRAQSEAGRAYVIFGKPDGYPPRLLLSELEAADGFIIDGVSADDVAGFSVSGAGDFNGDGIDDVIVGAPGAEPNGSASGSTYIVFGNSNGFPTIFGLSSLDGVNGFRIDGESSLDESGASVGSAGDVNGDGIDDIIIGAPGADTIFDGTGRAYVVFGRGNGFPSVLGLADLDGTIGLKLDGEVPGDETGFSVNTAGDINGDGINDIIVGARRHDANGETESGRSYVIFGRATSAGTVDDEPVILFIDSFEPAG